MTKIESLNSLNISVSVEMDIILMPTMTVNPVDKDVPSVIVLIFVTTVLLKPPTIITELVHVELDFFSQFHQIM